MMSFLPRNRCPPLLEGKMVLVFSSKCKAWAEGDEMQRAAKCDAARITSDAILSAAGGGAMLAHG